MSDLDPDTIRACIAEIARATGDEQQRDDDYSYMLSAGLQHAEAILLALLDAHAHRTQSMVGHTSATPDVGAPAERVLPQDRCDYCGGQHPETGPCPFDKLSTVSGDTT